MKKTYRSVEIDTDSMKIYRNGKEIEEPYVIHEAYERIMTFDWLKYNYNNNEDDLWEIAKMARDIQFDTEDDNPMLEFEAVQLASKRLKIDLIK